MTLRVALVGLGEIAQKAYLPVLADWEGLELLFCSRRPSTVAALQRRYRVAKGTADLQELIDWRPQAALVLAPTTAHYDIARQLLEAEIDVYLEKPATASSAETRRLAEQAEAGQRVLMVGFNRRYAPLHRLARELWGERRASLALFQKHRARGFHPNLAVHYTEEMVHLVDLLRYFCGEGEAVSTHQQMDGKLVAATSTVALQNGCQASLLASMQAGHWQETYALHGEGASLYVQAFSRVVFTSGGEQRTWEESYASSWQTTLKGRGFFDQIAHFLECVQTRAQPRTSGWEALKTQLLLEALIEQAG